MRHFVISIIAVFACVNTFASQPTTTTSTKKSGVVYVWGNDTHKGMFYHNSVKCAQSFKENISRGEVVDMKLMITTEKGATDRHIHECPFCGNHDHGTHSTAKK